MDIQTILDKILAFLDFVQNLFNALQDAIAEPDSALAILKDAIKIEL